ncbi:CAP domain-containing protein [Dolichospermum circinale CS-1225]|uniref:CAP domain-containing protein n=1 Tax=Dolichospermum circinale CS-537/01 TaxID=3021739 RepID=A0ABT5A3L4_9CYAN|nr:CAP domain-containing protein [Dolichospermum circinale]MDB9468425.1 CAP domain-containing protein [Dolichospermum circinale CS-539/09]MDB9472962.1 CAP domain-containing protein [Dolichospermum circinale CS-539]MDB9485787.1 CAP domain-containing protein [Dolichospermum circinale CS-537/01]MDB9520616.1 CAP domain-containing protein [Dolichospermum circinale CS-1225]
MLKSFIFAASAGFLVLVSGTMASSEPNFSTGLTLNYQVAQGNVNTATIEASVFQKINQYRVSQNLPALTRNSTIDNQARIHSQNMASGRVAFGHNGFSGRVAATGIAYSRVAENVAYNQGHQDPADRAVQGWLNSSGHLANIKGNYTLTGIGVASNNQGKIYFTQIFLRSR